MAGRFHRRYQPAGDHRCHEPDGSKKYGVRIFSDTGSISDDRLRPLVGLVGSFGFGFIDQKLGVKTAIRGYLVWYAVALLINVTMNNAVGGYICVAMVGIAIGAAANFMTSLPASVFGRHNFDLVYSIYFPIMEIVLMLNYIVNAKALELTGSLRGAYVVFVVLLAINFVLISVLDTRKYNLDYKERRAGSETERIELKDRAEG